MTEAQNQHLSSILEAFTEAAIEKYAKGAEEHGGNLWELPLVDLVENALEEAIDLYVYVTTIKQNLEKERDLRVL